MSSPEPYNYLIHNIIILSVVINELILSTHIHTHTHTHTHRPVYLLAENSAIRDEVHITTRYVHYDNFLFHP